MIIKNSNRYYLSSTKENIYKFSVVHYAYRQPYIIKCGKQIKIMPTWRYLKMASVVTETVKPKGIINVIPPEVC